MTQPTKALKQKNQQRTSAKRATLEMFQARKPYEAELEFDLGDGMVSMLYRAIGSIEYDKLIDLCPATKEQQADGGAYDQVKFMPLLVSKVCIEPAFSLQEWTEIFNSERFSRGEVGELFYTAVSVCTRQLGMKLINPTESDSA